MLTEAQTYYFRNPWLVAWPGLVLVALDPRQR
jgi:ABC-type dipeptide/oligopeptide/nickel transport system permease subunit